MGVFEDAIDSFLGPIKDLLDDDKVSEVMINGPHEIFVEKSGLVFKVENQFPNDYLEMYLEYYEMNEKEFIEILHKHTNDDLFNYDKLEWHPKFEIT